MIRLSGHVCSRPKVPDKRVFRNTESPIGPDVEIGSRIFVWTSEIYGLSEPGLTNHHCTYIAFDWCTFEFQVPCISFTGNIHVCMIYRNPSSTSTEEESQSLEEKENRNPCIEFGNV